MDELSRQFINRYQGGFPVEEQPFASVAADLGTNPATLIGTIQQLMDDGLLSRFGPLYDASSMGGSLTLAALSVPDDRFDEVTQLVNDMPEVAHNYQSEHALNMWFVVATETPEQLQQTIERIEQAANLPVYNFP
jgi:DNA-binding Lrp family transcriptional regulator